MINNTARVGRFTSSEIVALTKKGKDKVSFGVPALTYIEQTNFERLLGRSIDEEKVAKALTWGKLLEGRVFDLLGIEYRLCSTDTTTHPTIDCWAGSADGEKEADDTVMDIKCPLTLLSFCQLVDALYRGMTGMEAMNYIRENHKDGEKYYWQLVSNAILLQRSFAELIVYCPYKSELDDIRGMAHQVEGDQMSKHYWIAMSMDDELPFLPDGGYYKNLNVIRFEVPAEDMTALTKAVLKASELLVPWPRRLQAPDNSHPFEMVLDDPHALKA